MRVSKVRGWLGRATLAPLHPARGERTLFLSKNNCDGKARRKTKRRPLLQYRMHTNFPCDKATHLWKRNWIMTVLALRMRDL